MIDWQTRAAALATTLTADGAVTDPRWIEVLRATPRHVFVPRFHEQRRDLSGWEIVSEPTDPDRWADAVYADRTLVTELRSTPGVLDGYPVPISSSTLPSLMLRMLRELDVHDDDVEVVEIGTGTGYNAALLCQRVGDRHVLSVDVEPELVELARERLGAIGARPRLDCVDAGAWQPPPFDRLIATCGAPTIHPGWLRAARPEALLVVPLTGPLADGGLARLTADGDGTATGRFASFYAGFMPQRRPETTTLPPTTPIPGRGSEHHNGDHDSGHRVSFVDPALLAAHEPLAMFTQLRLPHLDPLLRGMTGEGRPVTTLVATDGSWARAEHRDGGAMIRSGGPTDLWTTVETTHDRWTADGRPGWDRLGLTATQDTQAIWLDEPDNVISTQPTAPPSPTADQRPADRTGPR